MSFDLGDPNLESLGWMRKPRPGLSEELPPAVPRSPREKSPQDRRALAAFRRLGWFWRGEELHPGEAPSAWDVSYLVRRVNPDADERDPGTLALLQRRLAIKLKPGASLDIKLLTYGLAHVNTLGFADRLYEVQARSDAPISDVMPDLYRRLNDDSEVEWAEYALVEHMAGREDPRLASMWQWKHYATDVESVWNSGYLGAGVRIAVVDEGFHADHEDLKSRIDDTRSGFFRPNPSQSFQVGRLEDMVKSAHGTACAGLAAAEKGNPPGGAGAAPHADLMVVALDPSGVCSQVLLARAIAYCAAPRLELGPGAPSGADVITCSIGPSHSSWPLTKTLKLAIDFAVEQGRDRPRGRPLGCPIFWPTANGFHRLPDGSVAGDDNVISVAASAVNQSLEGRSESFGSGGYGSNLDLLAPGIGVVTTLWSEANPDDYGPVRGTSFAAPCAAGIATLLLNKDPSLHWEEVKRRLQRTNKRILTNDGRLVPRVHAPTALA